MCICVCVNLVFISSWGPTCLQCLVVGTTSPCGDIFFVPMKGNAVFGLEISYVMARFTVRARVKGRARVRVRL